MERLMLKLEQSIHHAGWDQPPQLRHLMRRGANRVTLSRPMPVPWEGHPGLIIAGIADQMDRPTPRGELLARSTAMLPGWYGFLFASEGWMSDIDPDERDGRKLADIPGSVETRQVYAVDITGGAYFILRRRGEKPKIVTGLDALGGRVPNSLAPMVKAVAEYLPDDSGVDREALASINIVSEVEDLRALAKKLKAEQ